MENILSRKRISEVLNRGKIEITGVLSQEGPASWIMLTYNFDSDKQFSFNFKMPSGYFLTINWGDGTRTIEEGQDDIVVTATSSYTKADTYLVGFLGDAKKLTWIDIADQSGVSGDASNWFNKLPDLTYLNAMGGTQVTGWDNEDHFFKRGIFVLWDINSPFVGTIADHMDSELAANGDSMAVVLNYHLDLSTSQIEKLNGYIARGHKMTTAYPTGMSSFKFLEGEQTEFAAEIASGDIIEVTDHLGNDAAIIKITFNNYLTGELVNSTKQNGTLTLDNADLYASYSGVYFIPPGESGVPAELEEEPLWIDVLGKVRYYEWYAEDFFSVTFTNADQISLYRLDDDEYVFSEDGVKCFLKNLRNKFENQGVNKLAGFWESTGEGAHPIASVTSPAAIAAGMEFGTNSNGFFGYQVLQDRVPADYCTYFAHHYNFSTIDTPLATRIEEICASYARKIIIQSENEWTEDEFDTIYAKIRSLGMRIVSPSKFIELASSYPTDDDNDMNVIPKFLDNDGDGEAEGFTTLDADLSYELLTRDFTITKNAGHYAILFYPTSAYKGLSQLTFDAENDNSAIDRVKIKIVQNVTSTEFFAQNYYIQGSEHVSEDIDLTTAEYGNKGIFSFAVYVYYINSSGLTISNLCLRKKP